MNHAVHHIDMLCWMMGLPEKVTSVLANTAHDNAEVEDLSVSILQYPNSLAQITASVVHHGEEQKVVFQCDKAKISAPFDCYASTAMSNGFPKVNKELETEICEYVDSLPPLPYEGHIAQLSDVLYAIENDCDVAIGGEDGKNTIELITAIYLSGATNKTVTLPIDSTSPFYTVEGIMKNVPHFYEKSASVMEFNGNITLGSDYKKK